MHTHTRLHMVDILCTAERSRYAHRTLHAAYNVQISILYTNSSILSLLLLPIMMMILYARVSIYMYVDIVLYYTYILDVDVCVWI